MTLRHTAGLLGAILVVFVVGLSAALVVRDPQRPPSSGVDPSPPVVHIPSPVGSATAPPPNAVHVAPGGSVGASGSPDHPFGSLSAAVESAPPGGTIVLASGEYHDSLHVPADKPGLTIRAAPGAAVWLDGSAKPAGRPVPTSGTWRFSGAAPDLDRSPTYSRGAPDGRAPGWRWVPPEHPLAADPAQVWLDGVPLRQVAPISAVVPGTFAVEGRDLFLGDDPTGRDVRVGVLGHALVTNAERTTIDGIGIRRYVPSVPDFGAVVLDGRGSSMRAVTIADSSTTGVSVQGEHISLQSVNVIRSGLLGLHADEATGLRITGGSYTHNNWLGFNVAPVAGGLKITRSAEVTVEDAHVDSNLGNGLWLDEGVGNASLVGVAASGNSTHGVMIELAAQVDVIDARLEGNDGSGIRVQNSSGIRIWNVTSQDNSRAVDFVQDDRTAGSSGAPPAPDDTRLPEMTWVIGNSEVVNSVLGPSTGDADLAVEDFRAELDANEIGINLRSNVYVRAPSGTPRWTHVWSRPDDNPRVYESLDEFRAAEGQDRDSVSSDEHPQGSTLPGDSLPTDLAPAVDLPDPPGVGARS